MSIVRYVYRYRCFYLTVERKARFVGREFFQTPIRDAGRVANTDPSRVNTHIIDSDTEREERASEGGEVNVE